jgi:hypothetical protein
MPLSPLFLTGSELYLKDTKEKCLEKFRQSQK